MCLIAIIERVAPVAQLDRASTRLAEWQCHDSVQEGEIWLRRRDEDRAIKYRCVCETPSNCSSCVSFSENFLDYRGKLRDFSSEGLACSILKVFLSFTVAMWFLPQMCLIAIIERVAPVAQLDRASTRLAEWQCHDSVKRVRFDCAKGWG